MNVRELKALIEDLPDNALVMGRSISRFLGEGNIPTVQINLHEVKEGFVDYHDPEEVVGTPVTVWLAIEGY